MDFINLRSGYKMPQLIQGIPLAGPSEGMSFKDFERIVRLSIDCGVRAFDTSAAYGPSEEAIGKMMPSLNREELFFTTKISNSQMAEGHIEKYVDIALKKMNTEYIDCMLFHWPYPGYLDNWKKLEKVFKTGKIHSIGIANTQVRHVKAMIKEGVEFLPHVMQTEIHPFRTEQPLLEMSRENGIAIQACSSLMGMRPMLSKNSVLQSLADRYNKTLSQVVIRWHIQRGIAPIFRAFKEHHLKQTADVFSFELSDEDMLMIDSLNQDYRLHPESMNCPGY